MRLIAKNSVTTKELTDARKMNPNVSLLINWPQMKIFSFIYIPKMRPAPSYHHVGPDRRTPEPATVSRTRPDFSPLPKTKKLGR
jgi:hypothetical protein